MDKIVNIPKMSKIDLNNMFFEITLSQKGDGFRARSSSLACIENIKDSRPEAFSKISYENAIQKLIDKIEKALNGTLKKLGKVYQKDDGRIFYSVENVLFNNQQSNNFINDCVGNFLTNFTNTFNTILSSLQVPNINISQFQHILSNNISNLNNIAPPTLPSTNVKFLDLCVDWLKSQFERTKKSVEDEDYLNISTLEGYNKVLRDTLFPFLETNQQYDNIVSFTEPVIDQLLVTINCKDTKRILLIALKSIFEYSKRNGYISFNPIANKKLKRKKKIKKEFEFIEEENRAIWIDCMIKEINSEKFEHTDATLAFLCILLHGPRPEEACGTRWMDFSLKECDYHIQNAYKKIPVYDEETMKRVSWKKGNDVLKTIESNRHLSLDPLFKQLLLVHRIKQIYKYRKKGKKWSEKEYVFQNTYGDPFTSDILSRNFNRFCKRNPQLKHMTIYGLRHSFATHCRNLGMEPEILSQLMGHTEYQTTQKYYIHISSKQKKEALQNVQKSDIKHYLGNENKDLVHLQNNISKYDKHLSNLKEIQKDDMKEYLTTVDDTLKSLKSIIQKVYTQEKIYM